MYRFLYSPRWVALHIVVAISVVAMVNLAFWQIDRLHQRQDFNAILKARVPAAAAPLAGVLAKYANPSDAEWYRVSVTGTYLVDEDITVVNVTQDGQAGHDAITPLLLDDSRVLLVNRGFLPLSMEIPQAPTGRIAIEGRLRMSAIRRTGAVSDAPTGELQEVQRVDIDRLARQLPYPPVPMYVELLDSQPADSVTLSRIADPVFTNGPHLSYAVQWFLFSGCAVGGWFIAVRREIQRQKKRGVQRSG
ncbi:MAG: SURF1 family protein [Actinomycetota bacterium]